MNESERLAFELEQEFTAMAYRLPAAAELRRLSAINAELVKTLELAIKRIDGLLFDDENAQFTEAKLSDQLKALEKAKQ